MSARDDLIRVPHTQESLNEQIRKVVEDYEDDQGEFVVCHLTCLVGAIQAFVFDRETTRQSANLNDAQEGT